MMPTFMEHENKQKPLLTFPSNATDVQTEYVQTPSALLRNIRTMTHHVS
jgi:hypothetical protein